MSEIAAFFILHRTKRESLPALLRSQSQFGIKSLGNEIAGARLLLQFLAIGDGDGCMPAFNRAVLLQSSKRDRNCRSVGSDHFGKHKMRCADEVRVQPVMH